MAPGAGRGLQLGCSWGGSALRASGKLLGPQASSWGLGQRSRCKHMFASVTRCSVQTAQRLGAQAYTRSQVDAEIGSGAPGGVNMRDGGAGGGWVWGCLRAAGLPHKRAHVHALDGLRLCGICVPWRSPLRRLRTLTPSSPSPTRTTRCRPPSTSVTAASCASPTLQSSWLRT